MKKKVRSEETTNQERKGTQLLQRAYRYCLSVAASPEDFPNLLTPNPYRKVPISYITLAVNIRIA